MGLILGMDIWVFAAWFLTILAAIFCVLYGIYHEYLKKPSKKKPLAEQKEQSKKKEA